MELMSLHTDQQSHFKGGAISPKKLWLHFMESGFGLNAEKGKLHYSWVINFRCFPKGGKFFFTPLKGGQGDQSFFLKHNFFLFCGYFGHFSFFGQKVGKKKYVICVVKWGL